MIRNHLFDKKIVAVIRGYHGSDVLPIIESLVEGGIKLIEITMDSPDAAFSIRKIADNFSNTAIVGAGTVLNTETAKKAIESGAQFIVSPVVNDEIIRYSKENGCLSIPGAFSPTEVLKAHEYGADIVKVFPASSVGSKFIKDLKGPFPHIPMMPTGGISLDNINEFIQAGASAVGVGGSLIKKEIIDSKQYNKLTNLARQYVYEVSKR